MILPEHVVSVSQYSALESIGSIRKNGVNSEYFTLENVWETVYLFNFCMIFLTENFDLKI